MFNLASSSVPTGGNGLRPIRDAGEAPCPPGSHVSAEARGWITLSVGSLLIAGILSLWVVLGRLPVISHRIADPLAVQILEGKVINGEHLLVDALGNELTFTAVEALEA